MKKLYYLLAILLLAGCSDTPEEVDIIVKPTDENSLLVEAEQGKFTRNGFDAAGNFYWSAGDRMGVTTEVAVDSFSLLTIKSGAGTASARFEGGVNGRMGTRAVYPFSEEHNLSGNTLNYTLPAAYTYAKVDADFFVDPQGSGNSFNAPMWGAVAEGKVQMKHLGGVMCIKALKLPVGENLTFTFVSDQKINGKFTADLTAQQPTIATSARASVEEGTITITFSNATENTTGVFYIPAAVGSYEHARVKIHNGTQEVYNVALGPITINRCDLHPVEIQDVNIDINPTNFPDSYFRGIIESYDVDKNGRFSPEEIAAIKKLTINPRIQNVKGIEYFTSLEEFNCSNAYQVLELDLSKNAALVRLNCAYTDELTSINVSGCSKLTTLKCGGCILENIDLTGCIALKNITINGSFSKLDLPQCYGL